MASTKSFDISKQLVWRAYQRVKANKGAAGVDKISLSAFERNLKGNLYKIWNRMSSGSYMPPPVQQVNIPKKDGGTRSLGVPTVSPPTKKLFSPLQMKDFLLPNNNP